ncbi:hypothetical protein QQS21_012534 [Conoideocrella luteorostrata]|uniref:Uncharacterized protein n=1 Tax=Conoideocrella luteorostrata TaxID=1105319 RepID=A0AAJ0CB05_9HYPO|nr:hypothetical protein QQS21_012534 [Conoideocrella luteorostrata]
MCLKSVYFLLLFCSVTHGKQSDSGVLILSHDVYNTRQAQGTLEELKTDIKASLKDQHMSSREAMKFSCFHHYRPLYTNFQKTEVEIIAHENAHDTTASRARTIDITNSISKVDMASSGYRIENSKTQATENSVHAGAEVQLGASIFGVGVETSLSTSYATSKSDTEANTQEQHGEKARQTIFEDHISRSYDCPPYTSCSFQSRTYIATIKGNSPVIPIVDPVCFNTFTMKELRMFVPDFVNTLSLNQQNKNPSIAKFFQGNISMPSFYKGNEYEPIWAWTYGPNHDTYYTISARNNGKVGDGLIQDSVLTRGIWWPLNKTYEVKYKIKEPWTLRLPLFNADGKPKRSFVVLEKPLPKLNNREERGNSGANTTKVVILENIFT